MRKPRRFITEGEGTRHYHVVSRIVNRDFVLGSEEKAYFLQTMRRLEVFCGIRVITYCIMSNHFHILVEIPKSEKLSDDEVLRRMKVIYSKRVVDEFRENLKQARLQSKHELAETMIKPFLLRMHDLSMFMKDLKQRFTQWFNRIHERRGTLWEERFRSVLIEDSKHALYTVANYIDLNPVRSGICIDPKDYKYCGYGEAMAGSLVARSGLKWLWGLFQSSPDWRVVSKHYRKFLLQTNASQADFKEDHASENLFSRRETLRAFEMGIPLSRWQLLRCRVRYFSDGVVLGSRDFVEDFFKSKKNYFGSNRKTGARRMKGGGWGELYSIRNLVMSVIR
jgi:putative transposase